MFTHSPGSVYGETRGGLGQATLHYTTLHGQSATVCVCAQARGRGDGSVVVNVVGIEYQQYFSRNNDSPLSEFSK